MYEHKDLLLLRCDHKEDGIPFSSKPRCDNKEDGINLTRRNQPEAYHRVVVLVYSQHVYGLYRRMLISVICLSTMVLGLLPTWYLVVNMLVYLMLLCYVDVCVIYCVQMFSYIVLYPVVMLPKIFGSSAECMLI